MFKIMRIDHIVLRARDVPALVAFYHDVLGCPLVKVQEKSAARAARRRARKPATSIMSACASSRGTRMP